MSRIVHAIEAATDLDRWLDLQNTWVMRGCLAYFTAFALVDDWRWKVALYLYALICQIIGYRRGKLLF